MKSKITIELTASELDRICSYLDAFREYEAERIRTVGEEDSTDEDTINEDLKDLDKDVSSLVSALREEIKYDRKCDHCRTKLAACRLADHYLCNGCYDELA